MRAFAVLALLVIAASDVHAGACLDGSEFDELVRLLEKRVKDPKTGLDYLDNCFYPATHGEFATPRRLARINAACTKILTRDPADRDCITLAAQQGTAELAGVKIFDAVSAWPSTPWSGPDVIPLFVSLGDARAVPIVTERWKTAAVEATKREKKRRYSNDMQWWASWRQSAARVLGALGTEADIAFLEDQASATKDRYVKKACTDAIAAIRKRSP